MADTFVKWFYELLNSTLSSSLLSSSPLDEPPGKFRSDHFFPDASANISLQEAGAAQPAEVVQVREDHTLSH